MFSKGEIGGASDGVVPVQMAKTSITFVHVTDPVSMLGSGSGGSVGSSKVISGGLHLYSLNGKSLRKY